jgi:hypothetical protein
MTLSRLLTVHAVTLIVLGIAFGLYAPLMLAFFGVPELPGEAVLLYWNTAAFARLFGATLFGLGFVLWALRSLFNSTTFPPETTRGLLFSLVLFNLMGLFVALTQQFSVWQSAAGWVATLLFGGFTAAYAVLLARPS